MYVSTPDGRLEYVAASPFEIEQEMMKFYDDVSVLLKTELRIEEVFFYAAMIHLVFVKIHPWRDGNGRSARLIEKWFLAEKLGGKAWFVQSEKYCYQHHQPITKTSASWDLSTKSGIINKHCPFC